MENVRSYETVKKTFEVCGLHINQVIDKKDSRRGMFFVLDHRGNSSFFCSYWSAFDFYEDDLLKITKRRS